MKPPRRRHLLLEDLGPNPRIDAKALVAFIRDVWRYAKTPEDKKGDTVGVVATILTGRQFTEQMDAGHLARVVALARGSNLSIAAGAAALLEPLAERVKDPRLLKASELLSEWIRDRADPPKTETRG